MYEAPENLKNDIFKKVLSIISFTFIILTLIIIAITPPASGYEISIYDLYPMYFWIFVIIINSFGIYIIIHEAYEKESKWWLMGLIIIILSNIIVLGLPFFRGYAIYSSGDTLTHLGSMKDIITNGYIGKNNFYPIVHLLGINIIDITGLNITVIPNLLFVFWSIIYILNMYLLGTVITYNRKQVLLIVAFASPLVFSYMQTLIHPSMFSIFMLPLLLYLYHRKQKRLSSGFTLLLILVAFSITFTHPITILFLVFILLTFNISRIFVQKIAYLKNLDTQRFQVPAATFNLSLIILTTFFIWYFSYSAIQNSMRVVFNSLVNENKPSLFNEQISYLSLSGITIFQQAEIFIYRYSGIFLFFIISVIAATIIFQRTLSDQGKIEPMSFTYAIQFIIASLASAFSLFGFTGEYNPIRIARFFLIFCPIIITLAITFESYQKKEEIYNHINRKKLIFSLIALLILFVSIISIFNIYGSPRVVETNWQVSRMELAGMEWFLNHQSRGVVTAAIGIDLKRFEDFIFGSEYSNANRLQYDPTAVSSHFGYDKNSSISETFNFEDRYLITTETGRATIKVIPENIRYKSRQYTENDFAKLKDDPTIIQIYMNGEFDIWRVHGKRF